MQIAAEHPKAVCQRAGIGVKERLFLNRIALDAADVPPGYVQRSPFVVADLADAGLAFRDWAAVAARIAAHAAAVEFFVQLPLADVFVDDVAEGGHGRPRKNCYLYCKAFSLCCSLPKSLRRNVVLIAGQGMVC